MPHEDHKGKPESRRAVVAEDEEMLRAILAETLRCEGFLVNEACDGAEALAIIRSEPCTDLLVSDIRMPVVSGYQLVEAALKLRPGLKVVLMTGHALDEAPPTLRPHRLPVLQKPFDLDQFAMLARELVGLPTGSDSNVSAT